MTSPASEKPDADMMAVAERVAAFIATGDRTPPARLFAAQDVTIVENFPPFVFEGPGAVETWAKQLRVHLEGITALRHIFSDAFDFSRSGDEVYFSLPTTWRGLNRGKPFSERGGWAFVLTREEGEWRVLAYSWAVIESTSE